MSSTARNAVLIALVVVLAAVVAFFAAPLVALQGVRDALVARNAMAFAQAVDFQRLTPNLSARVHQRQAQTGAAALPAGVQPALDRLLTPDGLVRAICDGSSLPVQQLAPVPCEIEGRLSDLRFESINRFSAALTQPSRVAATVVFDREGLRWRVIDIVLPPVALD
jgi:hypothetical protein